MVTADWSVQRNRSAVEGSRSASRTTQGGAGQGEGGGGGVQGRCGVRQQHAGTLPSTPLKELESEDQRL